jgi:hypothetical protein
MRSLMLLLAPIMVMALFGGTKPSQSAAMESVADIWRLLKSTKRPVHAVEPTDAIEYPSMRSTGAPLAVRAAQERTLSGRRFLKIMFAI